MIHETKRPGQDCHPAEPVSNVRTPEKDRDMNAHTDTTAAARRQDGHPAVKMRRLARELSQLMAEQEHPSQAVIVFPEDAYDYPIMFMESRAYGKIMKAAFAYEKAHQEKVRQHARTFGPNESIPLPEKPEHKAYWDAFHRCGLAHYALIDAFNEDLTIEGVAA